jgi:cytochrome c-type biogenesis protein CcmH
MGGNFQTHPGADKVKMLSWLLLISGLLLSPVWLGAAIEELEFENPEQQQRYKKLTDELRCPKCLNSNISGSDAPIAADLRTEVHEQIRAGRSDAEIKAFMTARYGDFILYKPPLTLGTALLWFGPGLLLLAGLVTIRRMLSSSGKEDEVNTGEFLSVDEQQKLAAMLEGSKDQS